MKTWSGIMVRLMTVAMVSVAGCGMIVEEAVLLYPKVHRLLTGPGVDRRIASPGFVETIGGGADQIRVLYVSGTPYEMGFEHGRLLRSQVRATAHDVAAGLDRFLAKHLPGAMLLTPGDKTAIINGLLDRAWASMEPFTPPDDLAEMEGLAAGSGLSLAVIHRIHAVPDVSQTSCSALIARGMATSDHHVYQLRILDYGAGFNLHRRPLLTVYRPANAHAFVDVGWIGFVGVVSGVNDRGLALSEMGFGAPRDETFRGMPMPFLLKQVLRHADDAEQAAALVRATSRTNGYIYLFGDRGGGAVALVTSARKVTAYRPNEQATIALGGESLPQFRDVLYAGHYPQRQAALVREMSGHLDFATLRAMTRRIAMNSNLQTVIYDLTGARLWVANRTDTERAADRPYLCFPLAGAWSKHPASATLRGAQTAH